MTHTETNRLAVVGAGAIGGAFALTFARAGWQVAVIESDPVAGAALPAWVRERLALLVENDLVDDEPVDDLIDRIRVTADLAGAVADVVLVLECVPERLDLKRDLLAELDAACPADVIIASSSSAFTPGELMGGLAGSPRCLVAHPANPPYLLPVIELVPAESTATRTVDRAAELFADAGMLPVRLQHEVTGFVFNRLQGALLREAYCLVRDGVIGVEELDLLVREGLAPRWSIVGPFESVDLNTRGGIEAHARILGPAYARMGAERGQHDPWTPELVSRITAQRRAALPLEQWPERVLWRDRALAALQGWRRRHPATPTGSK